jgi:hypothetical protein
MSSPHPHAIRPLAKNFVELYRSPNQQEIFAYSPGLARLSNGRLIATLDLGGPGAKDLPGEKWAKGEMGWAWQGKIFTSDDAGLTWTYRADFPFMHARPLVAGNSIYVLGQAGDLMIVRSDDGGDTWSAPVKLTHDQSWHQAPCNIHHANGCVYLVMERRVRTEIQGWPVGELAPVLMRGKIGCDLTQPDNWTFASELPFYEAVQAERLDDFGVPFYETDPIKGSEVSPGRYCAPLGWLEANVVQFTDPQHLWHDPSGKTFHLWMRSHTGGVGYACVLKVVEEGSMPGEGALRTQLQKAPSGRSMLYVPCPGGQMKFHVIFDETTRLYWLLSTQGTDSLIRPDLMPADRYNLPNNERRRLQLHFSRNMVDWCFAGLVCAGPMPKASRHYASMIVDGEDLVVLSRSGDEQTKSPHDGNLITFHRIQNFRSLVY